MLKGSNKKEYQRDYMRKRRSNAEAGLTAQGLTQYHPVLEALIDPIKRKRLEDICEALDRRNLQSRLYYGCGDFSISFDTIEDLLEATS